MKTFEMDLVLEMGIYDDHIGQLDKTKIEESNI